MHEGPSTELRRHVATTMREIATLVCLLCFVSAGCGARPIPGRQANRKEQGAERRNAQERFLAILRTTNKEGAGYRVANPKAFKSIFRQCFREGDLAADYAAILATGDKRVYKDNSTDYIWIIWLPYDPEYPESSTRILGVSLVGDPQRIAYIYIL